MKRPAASLSIAVVRSADKLSCWVGLMGYGRDALLLVSSAFAIFVKYFRTRSYSSPHSVTVCGINLSTHKFADDGMGLGVNSLSLEVH